LLTIAPAAVEILKTHLANLATKQQNLLKNAVASFIDVPLAAIKEFIKGVVARPQAATFRSNGEASAADVSCRVELYRGWPAPSRFGLLPDDRSPQFRHLRHHAVHVGEAGPDLS
jgi:hypothetical protein